jgi:hypothetical protein
MKSGIRHHRARLRRRSFTLIEVIISISLSIALLGAMAWFVADVLSGRERIRRATQQSVLSSTLLERIEADLMTTMVGSESLGPGVRGTAGEILLLSRGVPSAFGATVSKPIADLRWSRFRFTEEAGLEGATGEWLPRRRRHGRRWAASSHTCDSAIWMGGDGLKAMTASSRRGCPAQWR